MSSLPETQKNQQVAVSAVSAVIDAAVSEAINSTCADFGMATPYEANLASDDVERPKFLSVIDFSGEYMSGYLAVDCCESFHKIIDPKGRASACTSRDWSREVANSILGKIKGLLAKHVITVEMETPRDLASQSDPRFGKGRRPPVKVFRVSFDESRLTVFLWANVVEGVVFTEHRQQDRVVGESGEMFLF